MERGARQALPDHQGEMVMMEAQVSLGPRVIQEWTEHLGGVEKMEHQGRWDHLVIRDPRGSTACQEPPVMTAIPEHLVLMATMAEMEAKDHKDFPVLTACLAKMDQTV